MNFTKGLLSFIAFSLIILTSSYFVFVGFSVKTSSTVGVDTGIQVIYDNFDGDTTPFIQMNDSELSSISNLVLERSSYGKIYFQSTVNLSESLSDNTITFDDNVVINTNYISIGGIEGIKNKSMLLYIYGLEDTLENPRIIRNGEVCPNTICEGVYSIAGMWVISANREGIYYLEDYTVPPVVLDPSPTPSSSSSSFVTPIFESDEVQKYSFSLNKDVLKINLLQGEIKREPIVIYNLENRSLNLSLRVSNSLKDMLLLEADYFILEPKGSRTIFLDFFSEVNTTPDSYTGRVTFNQSKEVKILNVIFEVLPSKALFDIKTEGYSNYLRPGKDIHSHIKVINLGNFSDFDVNLYYDIRDYDGRIYTFKEESFSIGEGFEIDRFLVVPNNIPYGDYVFYSRVSYGDFVTTSSYGFSVGGGIIFFLKSKSWADSLVVGVVFILVISILLKIRNGKKR